MLFRLRSVIQREGAMEVLDWMMTHALLIFCGYMRGRTGKGMVLVRTYLFLYSKALAAWRWQRPRHFNQEPDGSLQWTGLPLSELVSHPTALPARKLSLLSNRKLKSFFWKSQGNVPPATSWMGGRVGDQKRGVKKSGGNQLEKKIKIHVGLNKSRSSTAEILDLGFKVQSVPLPLAIWLF